MDELITRFQEEVHKTRQKIREQRLIKNQSTGSEEVEEVIHGGFDADCGLSIAIMNDGSKIYLKDSIPAFIGTGDRFLVCKTRTGYEFFSA